MSLSIEYIILPFNFRKLCFHRTALAAPMITQLTDAHMRHPASVCSSVQLKLQYVRHKNSQITKLWRYNGTSYKFRKHGSTLTPAWINKYIPGKVLDWITYPFPNGGTVDVREWISNFIPHFIMDTITYPCWIKVKGPGSALEYLMLTSLRWQKMISPSNWPFKKNHCIWTTIQASVVSFKRQN